MGTVLRVCGVGLALGSGAMVSLDTHGTFTVGGISGGEVVLYLFYTVARW